MGAVAAGGGLLLLLLLALSGGGKAPAPKPGPGPDTEPESAELDDADLVDINEYDIVPLVCEMLSAAMPFTASADFARQVLAGAFVGYGWDIVPPGSERARLLELTTAIVDRVRAGEITCDLPIVIDDTPIAGGYYQIKSGDTPLGIMRAAYPWASSGQRVELVKLVTKHPSNGGGVVGQGIIITPRMESTRKLIGDAIFSMYKRWYCNPTTAYERFRSGECYAVVFLPLLTEV